MDKYGQQLRILGQGFYGVVTLHKYNGIKFAIKRMKLFEDADLLFDTTELSSSTIRELSVIKYMDHPNLLKAEEVIITGSDVYMVMKYMKYELLDMYKIMAVKRMTYQLLCAVAYMHNLDIIHRDLKPENIIIDENYNLCVGDFGLSRAIICFKYIAHMM